MQEAAQELQLLSEHERAYELAAGRTPYPALGTSPFLFWMWLPIDVVCFRADTEPVDDWTFYYLPKLEPAVIAWCDEHIGPWKVSPLWRPGGLWWLAIGFHTEADRLVFRLRWV